MEQLVDLHTHPSGSLEWGMSVKSSSELDRFTVTEMFERDLRVFLTRAELANIGIIANCQKNSCSWANFFIREAQKQKILALSGMEVPIEVVPGMVQDFIALNFDIQNDEIIKRFNSAESMLAHRQRFVHQKKFVQSFFGIALDEDNSRFWVDLETQVYGSDRIIFYLLKRSDYRKVVWQKMFGQASEGQVLDKLNKLYSSNGRIFPLDYLVSKFIYFQHFHVGKPGYYQQKKTPTTLEEFSHIIHSAGGGVFYSPEFHQRNSSENENKLAEVLKKKCWIDGMFVFHSAQFAEFTGISKRVMKQVLVDHSDLIFLGGSEDQNMNVTNVGDVNYSVRRFLREWQKKFKIE